MDSQQFQCQPDGHSIAFTFTVTTNAISPVTSVPVEILELFLELLDIATLKTCRLVCKSWNQETCRLLQGKLISGIKSAPDLADFLQWKQRNILQIPSTLHDVHLEVTEEESESLKRILMINNHSSPTNQIESQFAVTHLTLNHHLDHLFGPKTADSAWIVENCAPTLTHLSISSYKDLVFIIGSILHWNFPHLQRLEVSSVGPRSSYQSFFVNLGQEQIQQFLMDVIHKLLVNSPKLHSFKAKDYGSFDWHLLPSNTCNSRANFQQIQHLEICARSFIFREILRRDLVPPLTSLILDVKFLEDTNLCDIFRRFTNTLEKLRIYNHVQGFSPRNFRDFPFFPSLADLTVSDFRLGETWLRHTPILKYLHIDNGFDLRPALTPSSSSSLGPGNIRIAFPSVETIDAGLIIYSQSGRMSQDIFSKYFPNVKDIASICG